MVFSTPIFTALEILIARLPNELSQKGRCLGIGLTYAGLGYLIGKGRDLSKKAFGITDETTENIQKIHDMLYMAVANMTTAPIAYYAVGARDPWELTKGGLSAGLFGLGFGWLMGYGIDVFRDLTGLKECKRRSYPETIRKRGPRVKKGIMALTTVTSIALTLGVYELRNKLLPETPQPSVTEITESSPSTY